jgi:hypothetical protein
MHIKVPAARIITLRAQEAKIQRGAPLRRVTMQHAQRSV